MTRRRKLLVSLACIAVFGGGVAGLLTHGGCSTDRPVSPDLRATDERSRRLVALAAEEAAAVADPDARLTRQLNLADSQIASGWERDARGTLAAARATLAAPEAAQLATHPRISGWVSIAELARLAGDDAGGAAAVEQALVAFDAIEDGAERCDYVMGIANELHHARGELAAATLLERAGPWTRDIDDITERRRAVTAFACALFNLDRYGAGQRVLQHEDDAAWRSDTLLALATPSAMLPGMTAGAPLAHFQQTNGTAGEAELRVADKPSYGKQLNYDAVFRGRQKSQTHD